MLLAPELVIWQNAVKNIQKIPSVADMRSSFSEGDVRDHAVQ